MRLVPLEDWMIVEEVKDEESKIIKPKVWKGKVEGKAPIDPVPWRILDIGPGVMFEGVRIPTNLKVGDIVIIAIQVIQTYFKGKEYFLSRAGGVNFKVEYDNTIEGVRI